MAKLYAELSSDKGGRIVSKSGDEDIQITLKRGNKVFATIYYSEGNHLGTAIEVHSLIDGYTILK